MPSTMSIWWPDVLQPDTLAELVVDGRWSVYESRFSALWQKHLSILSRWCWFNLLISVPGMFFGFSWFWSFSLMNLSRTLINGMIVVVLDQHIRENRIRQARVAGSRSVQKHVEDMLLVNMLLDMGYIAIGTWMVWQDWDGYGVLMCGFGWSIILQGGLLLTLDSWYFSRHHANGRLL